LVDRGFTAPNDGGIFVETFLMSIERHRLLADQYVQCPPRNFLEANAGEIDRHGPYDVGHIGLGDRLIRQHQHHDVAVSVELAGHGRHHLGRIGSEWRRLRWRRCRCFIRLYWAVQGQA
jgi:hypothetical protein